MVAFYSILMTLNILCMLAILISGHNNRKPYLLVLGIFNGLLFAFNLLSLQLHSAQTVETGLILSQFHMATLIIGYPFFILIFGLWTNFAHTKQCTILLIVFSLPVLIINFVFESSIRYGTNVQLIEYPTIFGHSASLLVGESNAYFPLIHVLYGGISLFLFFICYLFYKQKRTGLALVLAITIGLQVIVSVIGFKLDTFHETWVYMGGVPMTFLSTFILLRISRGFRTKSLALNAEVEEKKALYKVFADLAKISNDQEDDRFYLNVIKLLSDFTNAQFVLFGVVDVGDPSVINTKFVFKDGERIENFCYSRDGTPCDEVLSNDACVYSKSVASKFPNDAMLVDEKIEGYIGYPISDDEHKTVGLLTLLFNEPIKSKKNLTTVTDIFATRIGSELRREKLQEQLKDTAYRDYLTALPNRNQLLKVIDELCSTKVGQSLLILINVDHFGYINTQFDYEIGDQVLKTLADRLRLYSNSHIFVSRAAGDEFGIVYKDLNDISRETIERVWSEVRALVTTTVRIGSRRINLSCTSGAIIFPDSFNNAADIISAAEHTINFAQKEGRSQLNIFDPSQRTRAILNREIETDLLAAIDMNNGLSVHYQPKVLKSGKVVGAEALLRWQHPTKGPISPADFIPIAEETGAIYRLGTWVLERVYKDIRSWRDKGLSLIPISINVSALQLNDRDFIESLYFFSDDYDISPILIELELTETGLFKDRKQVVESLTEIRKKGFVVSIDDFGTGYSSLSYLSDMPIDVLKIDKSFVDDIETNAKNRELVKSIIAISKLMGFVNVAEGTETQQQVDILDEYGCSVFQGYFFSKPLPENEFRERLAK